MPDRLRPSIRIRHVPCKDIGRKRRSSEALHHEARRRIAALRAFHTGLVAESHKHLHVLATFTRHVEVLREERRHVRDKLASVEACCRELANLRRLRQPWRETYEDLPGSVCVPVPSSDGSSKRPAENERASRSKFPELRLGISHAANDGSRQRGDGQLAVWFRRASTPGGRRGTCRRVLAQAHRRYARSEFGKPDISTA